MLYHQLGRKKNKKRIGGINISWVTDLINNIPMILSYLVYGYVFLTAYYWISFKDNKDFDNMIIKSVATSFVLKSLLDIVMKKGNIIFKSNLNQIIVYVFISAVLGFVLGKVISHRYFNVILHKLHIGRTTNMNIWDDVIKPYMWIRVYMEDGTSYMGQYRFGEPFEREPIIALVTYQKLDAEGNILIDYSQNSNELIMVNTKGFDRIEVVYRIEEKRINKSIKDIWRKILNIFHIKTGIR